MKRISEYASDVESALRQLNISSRRPASLYAPVEYAMEAGGKRLRPVLTLMAADAFGLDPAEAMPAALALEFFHNFTLLHDDVMDNSEMRRNRESVFKKFGRDAAILSGDAMLGIAEELLLRGAGRVLPQALGVFNRMSRDVYEGQALDMEFEKRRNVKPEEYLEMIRLKTGSLLGACGEIGALLAGAGERECALMREYGENLGVAFQIEDDWLDTFGDSSSFGKPIGGDINQGKQTFLLVSGMAAGNEESKALRVAMELPAGDIRVRTVRRIYEKMQLGELARREAARFSARAMQSIKDSGLDEGKIESFKYLLDKLTGRKK